MLAPLYAFDREVIPAGTEVFGTVTRLRAVPTGERTKAMMSGDFTPLHLAEVRFTSMRLPDGRRIPIDTVESAELNSLFPSKPAKPRKQNGQAQNDGTPGSGTQIVKDQIDARVSALTSIPDVVRGPGKKDKLEDFLWSKLPYHPQFVRAHAVRCGTSGKPRLRFGYGDPKLACSVGFPAVWREHGSRKVGYASGFEDFYPGSNCPGCIR